ncbi:uncharacterized protein PRCAT00005758001 [Priceomyces carsonii]|uniref:uncharacterized protein n=1 Tax=Priceomyces carsonii TaxID=28549 RepID=UPI002ED80C15|nr:unnamed protein product [Priceomyces carsonii]
MSSNTPELPPVYKDEQLPGYAPSVGFYGMALMKTEFKTPYHYNDGKRSWKPILLEINSTQLNIYHLDVDKKLETLIIALYNELNQLNDLAQNITEQRRLLGDSSLMDADFLTDDAYGGSTQNSFRLSMTDSLKSKWQKSKFLLLLDKALPLYYSILKENRMLFEPTNSSEEFKKFKFKGPLMHSYTLSNLAVGEAPSLNHLISAMYKEDYIAGLDRNMATLVKYKNVLRVRVELKQLLFQFWSFYGMLHWFRNLVIGKDLALPVDERKISKMKTIPSRCNTTNNALLYATAAAASYAGGGAEYEDVFNPSQVCFDRCTSDSDNSKSYYILVPQHNGSSVSSIDGSVFSENERGSLVSNETSVTSLSSYTSEKFFVQFKNLKLFSLNQYYSTLEKQYISNTIPDLNSYDKWIGTPLTISSYSEYLSEAQKKDCSSNQKANLLISVLNLENIANRNEKYSGLGKISDNLLCCRNFLVHEEGLVSVID